MYSCPIEYDPEGEYKRSELVALIKPHRPLLCFFAQMSGAYLLGLDFERYDDETRTVPVYVIDREQARVVLQAEGSKFKRAYRSVGYGKGIVVTYLEKSGPGWLKLRWELAESQEFHF